MYKDLCMGILGVGPQYHELFCQDFNHEQSFSQS